MLHFLQNLLLAANCIEDAILGRTLEYNTDEESLRHYRFYSSFWLRVVTVSVMWFLLVLAVFEDPAIPGAEIPYWVMYITFLHVVCDYAVYFINVKTFASSGYTA